MTDIPIYSCVSDGTGLASVHRKVSLYGSERVCSLIAPGNTKQANDQAMKLAIMLCEALEAQREREETPDDSF